MAKRVVSILAAILLFAKAVTVEPTITPPPDLSNRQISSTPDDVIGYVNLGGSWTSVTCPANYTLSEWESWAQCCSTSRPCDFVTSCIGDVLYAQVGTSTCGDQENCFTGFIYNYLNAPSPLLIYDCENGKGSITLYRNTFSTTTDYSSLSASSEQSLSTSSSAVSSTSHLTPSSSSSNKASLTSSLTNPTTYSTSQTQSSSTNPEPATTSSSTLTKSNAWIAGAVIGPVFGALILALAFWVYRPRQGRSHEHQTRATVSTTNNHSGVGYNPGLPEEVPTDDPRYSRAEMSVSQTPSELPTATVL